jgi:signal transduction histidine kinase/ligand-binding sensor domain-containing protein/DNA-binding response OmpR family regulator
MFSQNKFENYQFRIVKEGISKRAIYTIAQDRFGFMWIGTNGAGLYKYDGVNYVAYEYDSKVHNSINSNLIYANYVDTENRLWIGTDEGLCLYNRNLNTFETIDLQKDFKKEKKTAISVKSIIQDSDGNLLLGTLSYGFLKLNLNSRRVSKIKLDAPTNENYLINCISKDKKGSIYLGTNIGLKLYDPKNNEVKKVISNSGNSLFSASIESLLFDNQHNLWIGSGYNGLLKLDLNSSNKELISYPITNKRILSMITTDSKTILCGTENDGLIVVNDKGIIQKKYVNSKFDIRSLKSNSIWSLYLDKDNRIWLGYYNKGLGVFDKTNGKVSVIESIVGNPKSLQTNSVTSIAKDSQGQLWISMEGGGVDVYNPLTKDFKHINNSDNTYCSGLKNNNIQTIYIDKNQNIWLGSWNEGIFFLKKGSKNFINYNTKNTLGLTSDRIISFSEDSKGVIWIGTFLEGLHFFDPINAKFYHCDSPPFIKNNISNSDVRKVLVDSNDAIWVGTTTGLYQVITNDNIHFTVVSYKSKMSEKLNDHKSIHTITSLYEAKNKELWIGTDGAGLFSYNQKSKVLQWHNDFKNPIEKSIAAILEANDGAIWVSGKTGITKLDLKTKKAINYSTDDGLLVNDFNNNSILKDEKGFLYLGSYEGLNYINPNQIVNNKKELFLYLCDFKLFNKSVTPLDENSPLTKVISETDTLVLNHNQSVFTLEFVGINYSHPGKNVYAYYLEGFENDWNYVGGKRTATYTNLPPGDYVFNVKSANKGGVWNSKPLKLYIEILPPFWRTNFAYFIYILGFVLISYYLKKFLQKRFQDKQAIQFERDKAIQIEKLNEKKLQFFTNISHEFRTPLTLIINPLEDIIKNKNFELPDVVMNKLQIIHKSSDRLSRLINELMDFNKLQFNKMTLHVQQVEVVSFTKNIVSYFEEEASSRSIDLKFESNIETLNDWLDPKMFEKIIFNIISNAFKVTADSGSIKIRINAIQKLTYLPLADSVNNVETFEISIEDTGAGLNKKDIKKIFDRFYQVNNLNKTYYGSTGIGLEVVRGFVELHKGKIVVDSTLGLGTTFTVIFPLGNEYFNESEILEDEYQVVIRDTAKKVVNSKEGILPKEIELDKVHTILIVEDNTELRNYLKDELKKTYKVIVAENGLKGFELAKQKLPDLILTDVIMPIMNGLELCKSIKSDLKTSHIPLLMLSAKALVQDKLEGIDSGADMYMSKPFDMDILKSSLGQLINSRQIMFDKFYKGITKNAKDKTTTLDNDFIQKTLNFIHENISESDLSVEVLASKVFLSRSQLYRKIKTLTGVSVNEFIRNVRLEKAKELIQLGNNNINEISYKVGFTSPSYFTKCYKVKYGHLPTYIEKNSEELD